jgi:hypothetical protein
MSADDHRSLASRLRARLEQGAGETDATLRRAVAARAAGGPPAPQPYDDLAREIGEASYRVTDAQVAAVRAAAGSDKAAFEIVMAAAIGAGLMRWNKAIAVLDEVSDAAP